MAQCFTLMASVFNHAYSGACACHPNCTVGPQCRVALSLADPSGSARPVSQYVERDWEPGSATYEEGLRELRVSKLTHYERQIEETVFERRWVCRLAAIGHAVTRKQAGRHGQKRSCTPSIAERNRTLTVPPPLPPQPAAAAASAAAAVLLLLPLPPPPPPPPAAAAAVLLLLLLTAAAAAAAAVAAAAAAAGELNTLPHAPGTYLSRLVLQRMEQTGGDKNGAQDRKKAEQLRKCVACQCGCGGFWLRLVDGASRTTLGC